MGRVVFGAGGEALRMLGTSLDITPEVTAQDRQKLLMAELNHRVKNNLATVQSIAVQTARRSQDMRDFLDKFEGRLGALARTHDVLTQNAWTQAGLGPLIQRELASFGARVRIEGPPVELPAPRDDKVDVRNLGMTKAPEAFLGLFSGKKLGKMLVKLA